MSNQDPKPLNVRKAYKLNPNVIKAIIDKHDNRINSSEAIRLAIEYLVRINK